MKLIAALIVFLLASAVFAEIKMFFMSGATAGTSLVLLAVLICRYLDGAYEIRKSNDQRP